MGARKWMAALGAGAGMLGGPEAAGAVVFDGNCQVTGRGTFSAPAGYLPSATAWGMEGRGGCTGTLDGVQVVDHPVTLRVRFADDFSGCAASLAHGQGTLTFGSDKRRSKRVLDFEQDHVGPLATIAGATAGSGLAYLTAYTQFARQDPMAPVQCATTTLTEFAAEWAMRTVGPLEG